MGPKKGRGGRPPAYSFGCFLSISGRGKIPRNPKISEDHKSENYGNPKKKEIIQKWEVAKIIPKMIRGGWWGYNERGHFCILHSWIILPYFRCPFLELFHFVHFWKFREFSDFRNPREFGLFGIHRSPQSPETHK